MSVKLMTTEAIQTDLATIHNMWGGGIPPEQQDRVNALKGELKRRGAGEQEMRKQLPQEHSVGDVASMTDDQLSVQLRKLSERISKSPNDDELQEAFANVRFELRKRAGKAKPTDTSFDPSTGAMHTEQPAKTNSNGHDRLVPRAAVSDEEEQQRQAFIAAQAERVKLMEQAVRKLNLAKTAADIAATMLTQYKDPNGDDVENVCTIALHVAENIFAKVGL